MFVAAAFSGCRSIGTFPIPGPTPVPTPIPTPTPDPILACVPLCVGEDQTGCKVVPAPGVCKHVCSTPWVAGGITLVDQPEQCPAPPTTPDPPVEPPAGTGQPFPTGHPAFTAIDGAAQKLGSAVNAAGLVVLGCALGSAGCQWAVPPVEAMDALNARLRMAGYNAGRYDDDHSGPWAGSDVLAVQAPGSDNWEEWSVYNYGGLPNGRHATAFAFKGAFRLDQPAALPFPKIKQFGRDPHHNGAPLLSVSYLACRVIDATPLVADAAYCEAEFPDNPGQWRLCPYSGEDDPERGIVGRKARRMAGEAAAGPYEWVYNGQLVEYNNGNPLQIKVCYGPGVARLCAGNFGSPYCQSVDVQ
jgi:hypothetical protein